MVAEFKVAAQVYLYIETGILKSSKFLSSTSFLSPPPPLVFLGFFS